MGKGACEKVIKDGFLAKKRITNDEYDLYEGLHEPIITQEQWDLAKAAQEKRNHNPVNTDRHLQNPFAGILVCGKCGAIMKRVIPDKRRNPTPWYRCTSRSCDCKIIKCDFVENSIYDTMQEWLKNYSIQLKSKSKPKVDPVATALENIRENITALQTQQTNICEYLEKGIYSIEMFTKRNDALSGEIRQLQKSEADLLRKQSENGQKQQVSAEIIPTTQHMLDSYPILNPEEKNRLWKLVLKKATVYRSPEDQLTINIYPNLPQ